MVTLDFLIVHQNSLIVISLKYQLFLPPSSSIDQFIIDNLLHYTDQNLKDHTHRLS
jgi:hypothetical protein